MVVTFSDLHTEVGLKALDDFLSGKSYVSGDTLTRAEVKVYAAVLEIPSADLYPNASKWCLLQFFSLLLPRFQFGAANKRGIAVCRDPEALVSKYLDPLVSTGSIRIRTGYDILRVTSYLQQNLSRLTLPFFILHGVDDSFTEPQASLKLYEEASSTDKKIKLYEGLLHDLLFEPEKKEITKSIMSDIFRR